MGKEQWSELLGKPRGRARGCTSSQHQTTLSHSTSLQGHSQLRDTGQRAGTHTHILNDIPPSPSALRDRRIQSSALTPSKKMKIVLPQQSPSKPPSTLPAGTEMLGRAAQHPPFYCSTPFFTAAPFFLLPRAPFCAASPMRSGRGLPLLRKQERTPRCLAGSWLIIAIGAESSLSASTLILINRSTATVPPCSSPEHSQPSLAFAALSRAGSLAAPTGVRAKSCTDPGQLHAAAPRLLPQSPSAPG